VLVCLSDTSRGQPTHQKNPPSTETSCTVWLSISSAFFISKPPTADCAVTEFSLSVNSKHTLIPASQNTGMRRGGTGLDLFLRIKSMPSAMCNTTHTAHLRGHVFIHRSSLTHARNTNTYCKTWILLQH